MLFDLHIWNSYENFEGYLQYIYRLLYLLKETYIKLQLGMNFHVNIKKYNFDFFEKIENMIFINILRKRSIKNCCITK